MVPAHASSALMAAKPVELPPTAQHASKDTRTTPPTPHAPAASPNSTTAKRAISQTAQSAYQGSTTTQPRPRTHANHARNKSMAAYYATHQLHAYSVQLGTTSTQITLVSHAH